MDTTNFNKSWAFDIHGHVDAYPTFFSALTQSLIKDGWIIHILTGSHIKETGIIEQLEKYGIVYSHLFSIADYHRENHTNGMWYDEKGDPWVTDEDWDKTKADYCKRNNISFCTDDTARYASNFETPFGYMAIQMHNKKPNRYLNYVIDMFRKRTRDAKKQTFEQWFDRKFGWFFCPPSKLGKTKKNKRYINIV